METRRERDSLGFKEVPADAYYGVQTFRAVENFPISGLRAHPALVWAYAAIKLAAARANMETGLLDPTVGEAIARASQEIIDGKLRDQFVVDVFQAGAGTSLNMNVNEVIANRACEILGAKKGEYTKVHPNDHVNMGQSTNDTFPTAMRLAALSLVKQLLPVLEKLQRAFEDKAREFDGIIKSGRTHLQDAAPIRLGQEFKAYALTLSKAKDRIARAGESIAELGIGGSAVGTGLNTHPEYRERVLRHLKELTGMQELRLAEDMREAMQSNLPIAEVSGALRLLALELTRIANDLRLLSSGPTTGLAEITLPPVQPGSSIMPGKVNPVMAEMLNMVCFQVIGNDLTIAMAVQAGQMELNVMMPVMAFNLLQSLEVLKNSLDAFRTRCVEGIAANPERCRRYAEGSMGLATAMNPYIGYEATAEVVKESLRTGTPIPEILVRRGLASENRVKEILDPRKMTEPGIPGREEK
ncbi:MAG: aspartate ammonia-lyase [bacterium]